MTTRATFSALLTAILVAAVILTGCSAQAAADKKTTLTIWYWNRGLDDKLIEAARTEFPNVRIVAQKVGGDFKSKLKTTLAAGSGGPDIVAFNDWVTEMFPNADRFYDLYELGARDIEPDYLPWKWQLGVTPQGRMVALPIDTGPTALFYRADLFEQAGLPSDPEEVHKLMGTWDDYLAAGKKLQDALGGGVKLTDNIGTIYTQVNAQSETIYFDKNDQFVGGDPSSSAKRAWELAVKASSMGLLANANGGTPEWSAAMNTGKIASFVGAVWNKEILQQAAPDTAGKWRVARAPGGDGNNGGSFLAIMRTSKHPGEAFQLIKWLQSPDNQVKSFADVNLFPSAKTALDSPVMRRKEDFFGGQATGEIFTASALHVKPTYFGPRYVNVNGIVNRQLQSVATQGKNPDDAWRDALARIGKELLR
ncbi:cellobiose transport system substrate-binding protein [Paenibacillus sp. UNC496MF]|uniref:ABC transporter substrate-binding protein n=1 Tax=Paenibacillus sp. UNC496MF TaxID=1502753 RepID=UPI0008DF0D4E|nr:extracellular solute-binding protein [Paenibacillus sp. UNC496MF]SFJ48404.1 cellobiose transport system substrate-binding protein [Paenibacillus sp. UNC496MF]